MRDVNYVEKRKEMCMLVNVQSVIHKFVMNHLKSVMQNNICGTEQVFGNDSFWKVLMINLVVR